MYRHLSILLLIMLVFTGCSKWEIEIMDKTRAELRALIHDDDDRSFDNGDMIGIYPVKYINGQPGTLGDPNNPMNLLHMYNSSCWTNSPGDEIYLDQENLDIYAYSPYDHNLSRTPDKLNLSSYPFDVSGNQLNKSKDFLWAKETAVNNQANSISLSFSHLMARVIIHIISDYELNNPEIAIHNTITDCTINLRTGSVTPKSNSKPIYPSLLDSGNKINTSYSGIIIPQKLKAGTPLFSLTDQDRTTLYVTKEDISFNSQATYTFNLKLEK